MNKRDIIKSNTITPINHKYFNIMNLKNLNLSLTNSIENSSYIILKDGTIKQKRHKNSYFEGFIDNKRLLVTMETEKKIRRVKSWVNDNKKTNLFYKANFFNFHYKINNNKKNKRHSDNIILGKLQRINMFENVFIDNDDNSSNKSNNGNIILYNKTENDNKDNINLNFSYSEIIKPIKTNNNNTDNNSNNNNVETNNRINKNRSRSKTIICNCNKYDNKTSCKFKNMNKVNKNEDFIDKRNMYKDLYKSINNSNKKNKKINDNKNYRNSNWNNN